MKLFNSTQIAEALGVSKNYVYAVKRTPDSPFRGGRYCDPDVFYEWVMEHPHFRASHTTHRYRPYTHKHHAARSAAGRLGGLARKKEQVPAAILPSAAPKASQAEELAPMVPEEFRIKGRFTRGKILKQMATLQRVGWFDARNKNTKWKPACGY